MTVFALRTELNGGVFVEITGDRLQQIEGFPGLTKVCADRARTRWRTVAEYRPFRHDGNYVLHP